MLNGVKHLLRQDILKKILHSVQDDKRAISSRLYFHKALRERKAQAQCDSFPREGEEGVSIPCKFASRINPSLPQHHPSAPLPWGGN